MGTFSYYLTLGTICIALLGATASAVHFGDNGAQAQGLPVAAVASVDMLPTAHIDLADAAAAEPIEPPATTVPRKRPRYRAVRGF